MEKLKILPGLGCKFELLDLRSGTLLNGSRKFYKSMAKNENLPRGLGATLNFRVSDLKVYEFDRKNFTS